MTNAQAKAIANFLKAATSGELGVSVREQPSRDYAGDAASVSYALGTAGCHSLALNVDVDAEDNPFGLSFTVWLPFPLVDPYGQSVSLKSTGKHRFVYVDFESAAATNIPSVEDYRTALKKGIKKLASLKYGVQPESGKGSRAWPVMYSLATGLE